jgi:hypothetical protein
VRAADGGPLHMALGSSLADLSAQLAYRGLYRLDAVDEALCVLRDVEPIYVELPPKTKLDLFAFAVDSCLGAKGVTPSLPRQQETQAPLALEAHHANS